MRFVCWGIMNASLPATTDSRSQELEEAADSAEAAEAEASEQDLEI